MATKSKELNFEDKLWEAADALRGNMDASEYRNVVLGLIFLKYVSDSFEAKYQELINSEYPEDAEDPEEYASMNIFWVPKESRWEKIVQAAKTPQIGEIIDAAMDGIEKNNKKELQGILSKNYASPDLDKARLGEVVDLISEIELKGKEADRADVLGRVYEFFLNQFASAEKKNGGEFYTPRSIVRTLVEMIEPYKGKIYDPCCGSGGMFVQSDKFVKEHQGRINDISVYGQEYNATTWKLAKMNLAIRGIDNNLGAHQADTFTNDLHKGERFDFILANPPFNVKKWGGEKLKEDARWKYGVPPVNNANYAWIEHIISKLTPNGKAGFVLANGALSTSIKEEYAIRKAVLEDDKIDAIVAMPTQMFYSTQIPVSLWFVDMDKASEGERERKGETLFIDAREMGKMVDRTHRAFNADDIKKIADTYHAYRGTNNQEYQDVPGFCKIAKLDEIAKNDYVLTPGRYVGLAKQEDDGEPYEVKMARLTGELKEQFEESDRLKAEIKDMLKELGYEI